MNSTAARCDTATSSCAVANAAFITSVPIITASSTRSAAAAVASSAYARALATSLAAPSSPSDVPKRGFSTNASICDSFFSRALRICAASRSARDRAARSELAALRAFSAVADSKRRIRSISLAAAADAAVAVASAAAVTSAAFARCSAVAAARLVCAAFTSTFSLARI